ncbi:MAG: twin-arginine translocase TatA/TatE family subunit [Mangrovibacterium sp.]
MYTTIIAGVIGGQEIIVILVIVLLLFGGRKIPELMKGLGKGMKEFKKASAGEDDEDEKPKKDAGRITE